MPSKFPKVGRVTETQEELCNSEVQLPSLEHDRPTCRADDSALYQSFDAPLHLSNDRDLNSYSFVIEEDGTVQLSEVFTLNHNDLQSYDLNLDKLSGFTYEDL